MSLVKHDMQISDDELREKIVEFMITDDLTPHTLAKRCGMKSGRTISDFISGGKILFMSRIKIIAGLKK